MKLTDKIKKVGWCQTVDDLSGNMFSYFRYLWCRINKRMYFGAYLAAHQGYVIRNCYMQKLVEDYCKNHKDKINILEIGSWAGGSAITWAEAIKKYSKYGGRVLCVDQWISYLGPVNDKRWTHLTMEKALNKNKIYDLFLHNISVSKHDDIIFTFKGPSSQNLPLLKNGQFDIVFIDGSHFYDDVCSDIEKSAPLIRNGGILCGDDLELQYPEVDKENNEKFKNADVTIDPKTKKSFHPGVSLGVWNYFKNEVASWHGFWAMKKNLDTWEKVILTIDEKEAIAPEHLQ